MNKAFSILYDKSLIDSYDNLNFIQYNLKKFNEFRKRSTQQCNFVNFFGTSQCIFDRCLVLYSTI